MKDKPLGWKPQHVALRHGGQSAYAWASLDGRSTEAYQERHFTAQSVQDLGGPDQVTTAQMQLIQQAARMKVLEHIAYGAIIKEGDWTNGKVPNAVYAFLSIAARRTEVLRLLGLERKQKEIPSLAQYLEATVVPTPPAPVGEEEP